MNANFHELVGYISVNSCNSRTLVSRFPYIEVDRISIMHSKKYPQNQHLHFPHHYFYTSPITGSGRKKIPT
jgi:hypothetical protein